MPPGQGPAKKFPVFTYVPPAKLPPPEACRVWVGGRHRPCPTLASLFALMGEKARHGF